MSATQTERPVDVSALDLIDNELREELRQTASPPVREEYRQAATRALLRHLYDLERSCWQLLNCHKAEEPAASCPACRGAKRLLGGLRKLTPVFEGEVADADAVKAEALAARREKGLALFDAARQTPGFVWAILIPSLGVLEWFGSESGARAGLPYFLEQYGSAQILIQPWPAVQAARYPDYPWSNLESDS